MSKEHIMLTFRRDEEKGKLWDWGRLGANNRYLYGTNQGYENKDDALEMARERNPGIPIFEFDKEGKKVQIV